MMKMREACWRRVMMLLWIFSHLFTLSISTQLSVKHAIACADHTLTVSCDSGSVIKVKGILLLDSNCYGYGKCCPGTDDCSDRPSEQHRLAVHRSCDGRQTCSFTAATQRSSTCRSWGFRVNNDYERVSYVCETVRTTTLSTSTTLPTFSSASSGSLEPAVEVNETDFSAGLFTTTSDSSSNDGSIPESFVDDDYDYDEAMKANKKQGGWDLMILIVAVIIAVIVIVIISVAAVVFRRRRLAAKDQSNYDNTVMRFRQLDNGETNCGTPAAETFGEPLYELEIQVSGDGRSSQLPLVNENIYCETTEPSTTAGADGLYTKVQDSNWKPCAQPKSSKQAENGDLMTLDAIGNVYDEVCFRGKNDNQESHVYGNVTDDEENCKSVNSNANIYGEATPWSEVAYEAVGMKPMHPESEYMMPTTDPLKVTSGTREPNRNEVYCSMDRRSAEQSA